MCGVRIEAEGLERIDRSRAYVIISNHRSYTDILVGNASIPVQFRWLSKKSLFKIPVIGLAMRGAGYIPIERERAVSASRSLGMSAETLKSGASVWIFPEGTRTPEKTLGRFKRGAFELARKAECPLLPVVFIGTDDIFERPLKITPRVVRVAVLDPLSFGDVDEGLEERVRERLLMEKARDLMQRSYDARVSRSS
jgi:1-acyl-sn-glycerol-3-phosphate acyltransferase